MAISCSLNKDLLRSNTCGYSLPEVKEQKVFRIDDYIKLHLQLYFLLHQILENNNHY
jgi:hypothetical protein